MRNGRGRPGADRIAIEERRLGERCREAELQRERIRRFADEQRMPGRARAEKCGEAGGRAGEPRIGRRPAKRAQHDREAAGDPDHEQCEADDAELGGDLEKVIVRVLGAVGPRELGRHEQRRKARVLADADAQERPRFDHAKRRRRELPAQLGAALCAPRFDALRDDAGGDDDRDEHRADNRRAGAAREARGRDRREGDGGGEANAAERAARFREPQADGDRGGRGDPRQARGAARARRHADREADDHREVAAGGVHVRDVAADAVAVDGVARERARDADAVPDEHARDRRGRRGRDENRRQRDGDARTFAKQDHGDGSERQHLEQPRRVHDPERVGARVEIHVNEMTHGVGRRRRGAQPPRDGGHRCDDRAREEPGGGRRRRSRSPAIGVRTRDPREQERDDHRFADAEVRVVDEGGGELAERRDRRGGEQAVDRRGDRERERRRDDELRGPADVEGE